MAEPYLSQIGMFGGNFAPRGYAFCEGQILAISQNDALYSLLGTLYGGDGTTTFALPDLRSRLPMHRGEGPGTSFRPQGARFGTETVTLTGAQIPSHTHVLAAATADATSPDPDGRVVAPGKNTNLNTDVSQFTATAQNAQMASQALADAGGNQAHTNLMPLIAINFIIALQGLYPSRN